MKKLIKQILKEQEFSLNKFYVPMFKSNGKEFVFSFENSYENDYDEYGRFYINIHDLEYYYKNPQEFVKLGYNSESTIEYNRDLWLLELQNYLDLDSYEDEEWIDYSGFNFTQNEEGIEALENMYIVEFHTSVVRGTNTHSEFDKLNESDDDDWNWAISRLAVDYRFFDIYVCGDNQYDEETGEDECLDGGSYFVKIPTKVVYDIWDYEVEDEYVAGPGDEGAEVIDWCIENGLIDNDDFAFVEYVREVDNDEFCKALGYSDMEVCGKRTQQI